MKNKFANYIDHTLLSPIATTEEIKKLCHEAITYQFKSVCINPAYISLAKNILKNSNVLICTVIGFPLGQNTTASKVFETKDAIKMGADEIDMVINIAKFKAKDYDFCLKEINTIKKICGNKILKVIVETCLLTSQEIIKVAKLILKSDADFIKTSTGFNKAGADLKDIIEWKKIIKNKKKIKAAGGIRTYDDLLKFIKAGADRIGTSAGVALINNEKNDQKY